MGATYDMQGRRACDACGVVGNVRVRTCPARVQYPGGGSLPYCGGPALCPACFERKGGSAALHAGCREQAAHRTAEELHKPARLRAGDFESRTGWGDWHPAVPKGMVGRRFVGLPGMPEVYVLLPVELDRTVRADFLSDYRAAADAAGTPLVPWSDPDRPTGSKEARAALVLPPTPAPVPAIPAQLSLFGA